MVSTPPKLLCTSAPTVQPPSIRGSRRLAVPMPPFQPNATVPRPAPTAPSATPPAAVRQDRGGPRVDRVPPDHGRVAYPHAVHGGDGGERTGGKGAGDDADVAGAGALGVERMRQAGQR